MLHWAKHHIKNMTTGEYGLDSFTINFAKYLDFSRHTAYNMS